MDPPLTREGLELAPLRIQKQLIGERQDYCGGLFRIANSRVPYSSYSYSFVYFKSNTPRHDIRKLLGPRYSELAS